MKKPATPASAPDAAPKRGAREQEAIAALTRLFRNDNKLIYNEKAPGKPVIGVELANNSKVTDADLAHLEALPTLETLNLYDCENVGDKGMERIKSLARLKELNLSGTKITDKGLANIKGLEGLQKLELEETEIGDAGVAHLKGLRRLEQLVLTKTSVTDAGLADVAKLTSLKQLWLTQTRITDKGLAHLKTLTKLEDLNVIQARATEKGVADLKKSLPKLRVYLK